MGGRKIEFKILRPVNPDGVSFVKYCWGALTAQLGPEYMNKHKKVMSRLIQKLGFKIDELSEGGLIEGDLYFETDENDEPKKMGAYRIVIYKQVKEINQPVEVEWRGYE